uniref:Ammonium transporter Rh type C n=1 Tax=Homo sapiens TaxID=9606 RepID=B4DQ54_HUMAN|nr:unnamed protein product [Homo sapiens]
MAWNTNLRWRLPLTCLLLQVIMVILFGVFVRYDFEADAHWWSERTHKNLSDMENEFYYRYPSFQDVHVMVFVGFGFLMTFLQRYGFSAVGFNFLLAAFGIQWALLMQGWFHFLQDRYIVVGVENLINADFCVASVCVAFGAVLGKVSPIQLLIMTFFQVTLFLWMYWPSFNSAISYHGDSQHRAAINTYCSLAACVLTSVAISSALHKKGKLDMVHIQNATLAGGVAVGTAAEMMLMPYGALIIGFVCGIISTLGFVYLTPFLESRLHIQDTCGINNLHGIPGIIGGIVGAVTAASASLEVYGKEGLVHSFDFQGFNGDWTARTQGKFQIYGLLVTLAMALMGGIIVGLILRLPFWGQPSDENCFEDAVYWEMPEGNSTVYIPEDPTFKPSGPSVPSVPMVSPLPMASSVPLVP